MNAQQATRAIEITPNPYGITLPDGLVVAGIVDAPPFPYMIEIPDADILDIRPGDMIVNKSANEYALITNIGPGLTKVFMSNDIFSSVGELYQIWKIAQPESACSLYIPTGGITEVVTAGQDAITFSFPVDAPIILPVKVIRLISANSPHIIALW